MSGYLNKEEKECDICGDSDGDVDLDGLDLLGGEHPGGHGDLAAVDRPEHRQQQQREDDVDADLHPEPELSVQLHQGLEHLELDQDEAGDDGDGAGEGEEEGQRVEEGAEDGTRRGRGEKPEENEAMKRRDFVRCLSKMF